MSSIKRKALHSTDLSKDYSHARARVLACETMRQHRLNREETKRYNDNRLVLLDKEGNFVRYASEIEAKKHSEGISRGIKLKVKQADGNLLTPINDREYMFQEIAKKYGDCQVLRFNGARMKTIRDPNVRRPTVEESSTGAPDPDRCQCSNWGGRVQGRHHRICAFNTKAPPHQRGDMIESTDMNEEADEVLPTAESGIAEKKDRVIPRLPEPDMVVERPPSPSNCECEDWEKPDGADPADHHPSCKWFGVTGFGLYTLDGKRLRDASKAEIAESRRNVLSIGTTTAMVDGREFLVAEG